MLEDAKGFRNLSIELFNFISDGILVAHNAMFEKRFLDFYFNYNQLFYTNNYIDTKDLCKLVFPKLKSYKLDSVLAQFDLVNEQAHRAEADTLMTLIIFKNIRDEYIKHFGYEDELDFDFDEDDDLTIETWDITYMNYWEKALHTINGQSRLYVNLRHPYEWKRRARIFYDFRINDWDYNNSNTRTLLNFDEIEKTICAEEDVQSMTMLRDKIWFEQTIDLITNHVPIKEISKNLQPIVKQLNSLYESNFEGELKYLTVDDFRVEELRKLYFIDLGYLLQHDDIFF